ncbi:wd and tetratricopeptide repeat protein, putative, partial [Perkinsus marinus ATCC 50983]
GCVNTLCWSEDGQLLLSGSDDTQLMLWQYRDGPGRAQRRPIEVIDTDHYSATVLAYVDQVIPWDCPHLVISCSADSTVRQFDIRAGPGSSQVLARWAHWRSGINAISGGWALRPYSV